MKRSELSVGMKVEVQHGREFVSFDQAVVVSTDPWIEHDTAGWRSSRPRFRQAEHRDGTQGVAVAVSSRRGFGRIPDSDWQPEVVQLRNLVPVGTKAAHDESRRQAEEQRQQAEDARHAHMQQIVERLGVESYQVRFESGGDHRVVLPTTVLEALLDEVEKYRAAYDMRTER